MNKHWCIFIVFFLLFCSCRIILPNNCNCTTDVDSTKWLVVDSICMTRTDVVILYLSRNDSTFKVTSISNDANLSTFKVCDTLKVGGKYPVKIYFPYDKQGKEVWPDEDYYDVFMNEMIISTEPQRGLNRIYRASNLNGLHLVEPRR